MAKRSADISPEDLEKNDVNNADSSNINHINNLISNVDEDEEFLVETEEANYKPKNEEEITKDIEAEKPVVPGTETASKKKDIQAQKPAAATKTMASTPQEHKKQTKVKDSKSIIGAKEKKKPELQEKPSTIEKAKPANASQKHIPMPQKSKIPAKRHAEDMRSKMAKHKHENKKNTRSNKISPMTWVWVGIAIVIVIVAAVLLFKTSYIKPADNQTINEIAATVNGEPIYAADIDAQYNKLNPVMKSVYTKETILNQTINELLLIQETKNKNIIVAKSEVDKEIENFKVQNNFNDEQLKSVLEQQNLTMTNLRDLIEKRLKVRDLLNMTILANINISDAQIKEYYDANIDQFKESEKAKVSHILILTSNNVSEDAAKAKIDKIAGMLNTTNFCDLVETYSEDPGSKDDCGIYTFGKGEMVPEFENAAFKLKVNETTTVKTVYGWHLIKKLEAIPARTMPVSEVTVQIRGILFDDQAQKNFDAYLASLKDKAVIVNYMVDRESEDASTQEAPSTASIQPANTGNIVQETAPADTDTSANQETSSQATATSTTAATTTTTSANLDGFAKCLSDKGIKVYGSYNNQKKLFGDSMQYINYIECTDSTNPQLETQACLDAGIEGYPTWIINGQKYPGEQTLDRLAQLSGCKI